MEEWKEYKLGEVCDIIPGFAFKSKDFGDDGYLVVKIKDICPPYINLESCQKVNIQNYNINKLSKFILRKGDFSIAMTGATIGKVGRMQSDVLAYINQRVAKFEPHSEFDRDFIYYLVSQNKYRDFVYCHIDSNSAQENISAGSLAEFTFKAPYLPTQRKIASILSSLDDKIELNRRINANLEEQAQALFKSWFIDFEPFKNGKFVDSELGMIPEGWKVGCYMDIVSILGGGTPKTTIPQYWNGHIPFFTPKDTSNSCFCISTEKTLTEDGLKSCSSKLYPKGTVFVTARGTVGKIAMAGSPMAMNQSCYAIQAKGEYSQYYIYLLTIHLIERIKKKANGAVFSAITTKDFDERLMLPQNNVVHDFNKVVQPMFDAILNNLQESARLSALRDTLLPKLMSGEIEIND